MGQGLPLRAYVLNLSFQILYPVKLGLSVRAIKNRKSTEG